MQFSMNLQLYKVIRFMQSTMDNVSCIYTPQAPTELHCCSKCHRKQLNHCIIQLASRVMIYNHVQLCQRSGESITDNRGTRGHVTWLTSKLQQKQTEQPLELVHTQFVSGLMWLLNGDKRWVLKWCAYKTLLANLVTIIIMKILPFEIQTHFSTNSLINVQCAESSN